MSLKSLAVQRLVLEASSVLHVPQNQHDKLLIMSAHLSVKVRPSVAQCWWTMPHNTGRQSPPAVWLSGWRCLKASVHIGPSDSCISTEDDVPLMTLTSGAVQHLTESEQHFFFHSLSFFGSLSIVAACQFIFSDMYDSFKGKNCVSASEHSCVFSRNQCTSPACT